MFEEPPILATPPLLPPPPERLASRGLIFAATAVAVINVVVAVHAVRLSAPQGFTARQVGYVIGATVVWPGIILGLSSIAKRFRNPRSCWRILLWTWVICLFGNLGSIRKIQTSTLKQSAAVRLGGASDAPQSGDPDSSASRWGNPDEPDPPLPAGVDFSLGSDQRLIRRVESGEADLYHTLEAGYRAACAAAPFDQRLAEERVRFIEHFCDREDNPIETAEGDYDKAFAYLAARFPRSPVAVLHELGGYFSPNFEADAKRHLRDIYGWSPADRAEYFLRCARAAEHRGDVSGQLANSTRAFAERPSADAGLLKAAALLAQQRPRECAAILRDPVFASAPPFQERQAMNLLFEAGDAARALKLYSELKKSPYALRDSNTLSHIIRYGPAGDALAAYRQFRAAPGSDPLFRTRFELLRRFPTLAWTWQDVADAWIAILVAVLIAALPLLLLAPVHYWSLLRARRGSSPGGPGARWGLRDACVAGGLVLLGSALPVWWWARPGLPFRMGTASSPGALDNLPQVSIQAVFWLILSAVVASCLWRRRAWRLLGPGEWTWSRAVGQGLFAAVILRVSLGIYAMFFPQAFGMAVMSLPEMQTQFIIALSKAWGPIAAIATMGLLVPVLEEVLFRGVFLQALESHIPFGAANVIQALFFTAMHESLLLAPFFIALGIVNGILAKRCHGLFPAILVHSVNNLTVTVVILVRARLR